MLPRLKGRDRLKKFSSERRDGTAKEEKTKRSPVRSPGCMVSFSRTRIEKKNDVSTLYTM
jgi:hypothetical protein